MCNATTHTLIYYGGIKIIFSIFIFLSMYNKYKKYKKYMIMLKDKYIKRRVLDNQDLGVLPLTQN